MIKHPGRRGYPPGAWATVGAVGNPWLDRRVLAYAHRGGAREAPSNTILAMRQALAAGATALEVDVHPTSDGHLVVCHDPWVDRTTNGAGQVGTLTFEELRRLDAGSWFDPQFKGEAIPTLREVLDLCVSERGRGGRA